MKKFIIAIAGFFIFTSFAYAEMKMGTGGPTGNYFSMGNDISTYCSEKIQDDSLVIENSDGSVENLIGMTEKKFSLGIVQEDVLQYYSKQDPTKINKNRQKIISGLHIETVHLLIPKDYKPETNGGMFATLWSKVSSEDNKPISLDLLKDQTIGSWGGSIVSAKALSYFMDLNLNVVEVPENNRKAVNMPLILVGGQPYKPVEEYLATNKYVLCQIDFNQISARAPFYVKMNANYRIGGKITAVPTFGVRALLLGKSFRNEDRNKNMENLSQCISDNLEDLADDSSTNPNWGVVYELETEGAQTNWTYFKIK